MKLDNNANAGSMIMMVLLFFIILVSGAYGVVMLDKADAGYGLANNTSIGKTAETNNELIAGIMGAWPILGIIGVALLIVFGLSLIGSANHGR